MRLPFSDVPAFRRDPLALMEDRAFGAEQGFIDLHLGPRPITMVTDPELARRVLLWKTDEIDKGRLVQTLRPLVGDSLIVNTGEAHKRSKAAIHRHLQRNAVAGYLPHMCAIVTRFAAGLASTGCFTTTDETPLLSLRLGCAAFFGENVISDADQLALVKAVQTVESQIAEDMFSVFANLPWKAKAKATRIREARDIVAMITAKARKTASPSSLLASMEAGGLSDEEIVSELLGLFIAGHHTTGATIGWMAYHLACDHEIGEMLALEADGVLGQLEQGNVGALKDAPLSEAFAKEVMRLYPGGWWTSREALVDLEIEGRRFRKGAMLMISPWVLHRDARTWEAPTELKLDRSFTGAAYMPFGVGPRVCIGMNVALIELQLIALQLASALNFRLTGAPSGEAPVPSVALLAPPFEIAVEPKLDEAFRQQVA